MEEEFKRTLKKVEKNISTENIQTSLNTDILDKLANLPGDPDCPFCSGLGYIRNDVPVEDPDFGKVKICSCRQDDISDHIRRKLFSLSNLNELSNLTFDNFQPRGRIGLWPYQAQSIELAYNQARQFALTPNGWLVLIGAFGCGKTHLAASIANQAVANELPTLFITVPDLLDSLRFSYNDPEVRFQDRFESIRNAPLLILDDFGTQNATPWAQEKLFQIINYRYINRLPMVVTTNLPIESIEGRIRSRLEDPDLATIVRIDAPDYRRPAGDIGHHELSSLDLLHDRTFNSFQDRKDEGLPRDVIKNLEKAVQISQNYASDPKGWLLLMGPYGCGKTHLAAAIGNFRTQTGQPPLLIVVPDLLDHLRATFAPESTISLDRRFLEIRNTPFLILDDLGTQATSAWVKEKLYQLFNHRFNAQLPTVITTSNELEEIDARLRSRLIDKRYCTIFAITAPAYTGKQAK
ncbi:MAG: ATP-binding protein [Anaerolineales bacterium]